MDELGICIDCEELLTLSEIRKGRCNSCGCQFDPWEIEFAGDIHKLIERKYVLRES